MLLRQVAAIQTIGGAWLLLFQANKGGAARRDLQGCRCKRLVVIYVTHVARGFLIRWAHSLDKRVTVEGRLVRH